MALTGNRLSALIRFSPARRTCKAHHQAVKAPPATTSTHPPARGQVSAQAVRSRQAAPGIR